MLKRSDAVVTFDAADYHPENTVEVRKWFAETSRKVYFAGPLLPSGEKAATTERLASQDGQNIITFLDKQAATRGQRSVIYVGVRRLSNRSCAEYR